MATLYRWFLRPFAASFSIGARVGFCRKSGVKPPPWIMKPSITRWKSVLLKWPARTYSRKLATVLGACSASRSSEILPWLV